MEGIAVVWTAATSRIINFLYKKQEFREKENHGIQKRGHIAIAKSLNAKKNIVNALIWDWLVQYNVVAKTALTASISIDYDRNIYYYLSSKYRFQIT